MAFVSGSWVKHPSAAGREDEDCFFLQSRGSPGVQGCAGGFLAGSRLFFSFVVGCFVLFSFCLFIFCFVQN